ncbi:amino acid transporter, partial [Thalassiosira pseudonana CCMP1335]
MSLFDLTAFGVGCTIGSGVFVLAGVAAHSYAGPAASISYLVAGAVAALSGLPYAELSAAFPMDGSTYAYSYITLGEVFALMSSLCQTLEYGGSSAAVARSWGNKFVDWLRERHSDSDGNALPQWVDSFLDPGFGINPMAAIIAFLCTLLLLWGVQESKMATNVVSSAKLSLITFMILSATFSNWDPFVPPEFGPSGIIQGSSILFFAFLGYDQICNLSGEAKNPVKDVPRAVVYTLMIDGGIYMMAALALTAMLPYTEISTVSGFPRAFGANGWIWAEKLTAIGEIVTLPLVVLTGVQSQTRLLFAMSKDKLVPELFGRLTFAKKSASPCGCINACSNAKKEDKIAAFVPFQYMDDLISAGALFLFSLTDCCLLILRYKCPSESFLGTVEYDDTVSIFSIATVRKDYAFIPIAALQIALTVVFALLTLGITIYMALYCPEQSTTRFSLEGDGYGIGRRRFRTPLVPYLPALGIFANWFMIANVGWVGIVMLVCYLLFGILVY